MSVPAKNTTWGTLIYEDKEYGVLSSELSDEIVKKIDDHIEKFGSLSYTSAPWRYKKDWCIEDNRLYLTKLYTDEFHKAIFGSAEKIFADWVENMELLIEDKKICKTFQKQSCYIKEITTLNMTFNDGYLADTSEKKELYRSIELKNYIDRHPTYVLLHIDGTDLLWYLENLERRPEEDQMLPLLLKLIDRMIQKGSENDISLGIEDVKSVLRSGDLALFASAKGSDIDEMVGSLADSITDGYLAAKGCLLHITMQNDYPLKSIEKIVNQIEDQLRLNSENASPIYFGTLSDEKMVEDEILIRMLVAI